jgi:hypothetical protein
MEMQWKPHRKKIKVYVNLQVIVVNVPPSSLHSNNTNPVDLQLTQRTYIYKCFNNLQKDTPPFFSTTRWRQLLYRQTSPKSNFKFIQNYFLMYPILSVVPVVKPHLK